MRSSLIIGVIALMIGISMILVAVKKPKWFIAGGWETFLLPGVFVTLWGIVWFGLSLVNYLSYSERYNLLVNVYESQHYEVAEGTVHVLSVQPEGGHAPGDNIRIGDVKFEVDYYSGDFGYGTSIAHHGILTEGTYAKVYYYDGRILRIDLKQ
jgi:hypothetical protein